MSPWIYKPHYKLPHCDDCGQFARMEDLEDREPWNGGMRHKCGTGCWPKVRPTLHAADKGNDPAQIDLFSTENNPVSSDGTSPAPCG